MAVRSIPSKEIEGDSEVISFCAPPRSSWATELSRERLPSRRAGRSSTLPRSSRATEKLFTSVRLQGAHGRQ
eukprot:10964849-Heterocapsa_arctica.AAC.1